MDYSRIVRELRREVRYYVIHESAATNPATDPSIPPKNGSCPWKLLPREIRDEVLRHAYGRRSSGIKLVLKNEFELYGDIEPQDFFSDLRRIERCGIGFNPFRFKHYIDRFLVSKTWASEAAQAFFSTTEIRFESPLNNKFLPRTCLGVAELSVIHLDMRDVGRFAGQLTVVCPRLRRLRISATNYGAWVYDIGGNPALYSAKWTQEMVTSSRWFRTIKPLSGLEEASIHFARVQYHFELAYTPQEQDIIQTNTALVQCLFKQSATRSYEAPLPLPVRRLLRETSSAHTDATSLEPQFKKIMRQKMRQNEAFQEKNHALAVKLARYT